MKKVILKHFLEIRLFFVKKFATKLTMYTHLKLSEKSIKSDLGGVPPEKLIFFLYPVV